MTRNHPNSNLREKLSKLPHDPGVYLMKDGSGRIIYVGKAKDLKNRVRSYFIKKDQLDQKTQKLVNQIHSFDIIKTNNEVEALLTERSLIRHHAPKFNVIFRDDKEYPYVRVDFNEKWPRIEKVRRRKDDGAFYLGPFGRAGQLQALLKTIYRVFPLIKCSRHEFKHAKRPCNYYHIKMCLAPCTLDVSHKQYIAMVNHALQLLQGKNKIAQRALEKAMRQAAKLEQYEQAASYRDQLKAIEDLSQKQTVIVQDINDADVIDFVCSETRMSVHILAIRDGALVASESFSLTLGIEKPEHALETFLLFYYEKNSLPSEIVLRYPLDDISTLSEALGQNADQVAINTKCSNAENSLKFDYGSSTSRKDLLDLVKDNARYQLEEAYREQKKRATTLSLIKETLKLRDIPQRIECIDISNLQASAICASCVCFIDGIPAKDEYRSFTIKTVTERPDDYQSIREVVKRRLKRAANEGDYPDLLIIDGGRGQLNAALDAYKEYEPCPTVIVGLAKSRKLKGRQRLDSSHQRSFERLFTSDHLDPIVLQPGSSEFRLLTQIRDEAHRFALSQHRKKRGHLALQSALDSIPGVGPATKKKLLAHFGSTDAIKSASLEKLLEVSGISEKVAVSVHSWSQELA